MKPASFAFSLLCASTATGDMKTWLQFKHRPRVAFMCDITIEVIVKWIIQVAQFCDLYSHKMNFDVLMSAKTSSLQFDVNVAINSGDRTLPIGMMYHWLMLSSMVSISFAINVQWWSIRRRHFVDFPSVLYSWDESGDFWNESVTYHCTVTFYRCGYRLCLSWLLPVPYVANSFY